MNGASKCVHSDWRKTHVESSSFHVWMSGALHAVPSFHAGSGASGGSTGGLPLDAGTSSGGMPGGGGSCVSNN